MQISLTAANIQPDDMQGMIEAVYQKAISAGALTELFEARFSQYLGVAGGVATNSGTSALILALKTLGIGPGDEVIMPSYTCLAVLNSVVQVGATPQLTDNSYDVAGMNYNLTPELVREKVTSKTKAIIVPHMFGVPAEIDQIVALGLPVIEDITLSLGAWHRGKPVGAWGDVSVCSFHKSKMIACGEGGMFISKNVDLYRRARYLNGWESEQADLRTSAGPLEPFELRYNFRLNDIAAALGLSQLAKLPDFIAKRRHLAERYTTTLSGIDHITLPTLSAQPNVFYRYMVELNDLDVVAVIKAFANYGIEVGRGVYPPLHHYLGFESKHYPGAERAIKTLISIPLYPDLSDEQVEHILTASRAVLQEAVR